MRNKGTRVRRLSGRSGSRECDVCGKKRKLILHHICGRDIPNALWNQCWICPDDHDSIHSGDLVLEGWITTTEGKVLAWHYAGEEPKYLADATVPLYKHNA
jgi:hypothetical protein